MNDVSKTLSEVLNEEVDNDYGTVLVQVPKDLYSLGSGKKLAQTSSRKEVGNAHLIELRKKYNQESKGLRIS